MFNLLLTVFLGMIAVGQLVLIVALFQHFRHSEPTTIKAAKELEKAEKEGQNIIYSAFKKAKDILGQAELEGIKRASDTQLQAKKFEREYEEKFAQAVADSQKHVDEALNNHLNQTLANFDKRLEETISKLEKDSLFQAQSQLDQAKKSAADFEKSQLDRINNDLVDVVETTIARVLKKKLTVSDQLDSIYEAFNQARAEKFL